MKSLFLILLTFFSLALIARAQAPAENIEVKIDQIITRAEDHFRKGKLAIQDGKHTIAKDEFDLAIDAILASNINVQSNKRLELFYLELVERIYREEIATKATKAKSPLEIGFREKPYEPSPLDSLSKLVLDDTNVESLRFSRGPTPPKKAVQITSKVCTLTPDQSPEVRGLKLGQSYAALWAALPRRRGMRDATKDQVGLRKEIISKYNLVDETLLSGVKLLSLWYLDDKLISIDIAYDHTIPWQSNLHFTSAIVEKLGLPKTGWKNKDPAWLACRGFYVQTSSSFSLLITRYDLGPEITKRLEANKRRRRAEFTP